MTFSFSSHSLAIVVCLQNSTEIYAIHFNLITNLLTSLFAFFCFHEFSLEQVWLPKIEKKITLQVIMIYFSRATRLYRSLCRSSVRPSVHPKSLFSRFWAFWTKLKLIKVKIRKSFKEFIWNFKDFVVRRARDFWRLA